MSAETEVVLDTTILPALEKGGYTSHTGVDLGQRLGAVEYQADVAAEDKHGHKCLISLRWQQVASADEEEVPFDAICLAEGILDSGGEYSKAYLVLGGSGWSLREFFVGGGLSQHLRHADLVTIMTLEDFVAKANSGEL